MRKSQIFVIIWVFIIGSNLNAQSVVTDTSANIKKNDKQKSGWNFGAVPAIAFDADLGFKYGAIVNLFNYGDGKIYPEYLYSIYAEWSRTTKGSGINQLFFDSKYLLPKGIRITADLSLLTEKALDFYGFNGYESYYNHNLENDQSSDYLSRVFYRHERKLVRFTTDFQGKMGDSKFRWIFGLGFYGNKIGPVDINLLNKGLPADKKLPDTAGLYDKYVEWKVIPTNQADGGNTTFTRFGLVYDSRDNEPNPMKGIWSEAILLVAPKLLGNGNLSYSQLSVIHRQYFTLVEQRLSLACRLGYQTTLTGKIPFYMMPFIFNSYQTRDGVGGAKTTRGILRNRIVGEGMTYGNFELRWKFLRTMIFNQNLYIAISGFTDLGMVTKDYKIDDSNIPPNERYFINNSNESLHMSYGSGLHFALNQNFIVAVDYGIAKDKRDGTSGLYINLNFLY